MKALLYKIIFHYKYVGRDKLEHFYSGALGFYIFYMIFNDVFATTIVSLVALLKEIYNDLILGKGNPEVLDFIFTCMPIIAYWLHCYIV